MQKIEMKVLLKSWRKLAENWTLKKQYISNS